MDDMKDSGIPWLGEIPAEWKIKRLKFMVDHCDAGAWGEDVTQEDTGIVCIRVADFKYDRLCIQTNKELTKRKYKDHIIRKLYLQKGDLLIEKSGGGEMTPVGRCVMYCGELENPVLFANFIERIRIVSGVCQRYILYVFAVLYNLRITTLFIRQTTGIQNLSLGKLLNETKIIIPLQAEQQNIVRYLDEKCGEIDGIVAKIQQEMEMLKQYKQSIISEAVTKGIRPNVPLKNSGVEWIDRIPSDWDMIKLKFVTNILRGKFSHRPRNDPRFYDGKYPFVQTGDVARANKYITEYSQTLNEKGFEISKEFPAGSVCMTIAANIGDVAILTFDACFPDSVVGFVPADRIIENYLYYVLNSMKIQFTRQASISTQLNINIEIIKEEKIPLCSLSEQREIAAYLDQKCAAIDGIISSKEEQLQTLSSYKKSLIYEYVTGKKRVPKE